MGVHHALYLPHCSTLVGGAGYSYLEVQQVQSGPGTVCQVSINFVFCLRWLLSQSCRARALFILVARLKAALGF